MVGPFEAQVEHLQAGASPDPGQGLVERLRARRGEHEPEVEGVLALVVVVDRGTAVHAFGDRLEPRRRNRHRRQRARSDAARREHRADAAHQPAAFEHGQAPEHLSRFAAEAVRDLRKGGLADGEAALVLVEQPPVQGVEGHCAGRREADDRHGSTRRAEGQGRPERDGGTTTAASASPDGGYRPMRWARAEKKMPLGRSAAISASFS